jgi:hypothetical protein
MLLFDDDSNGYRHQVLPLANTDPVVQRAVCVVAAFHLSTSRAMPELRAPAESGRAAIISKLRETAVSAGEGTLSELTWATLLLLIVGDLVTGHEHVIVLYKMLRTFMDAYPYRPDGRGSKLLNFLYYQSRL